MNKKLSGFTLIEVLVDISIFSIVSLAVISSYMASFRAIDYSKAKIASVALANEKMEDLRNMPYNSLATEHGPIYPPGNIVDEEIIYRQGIKLVAVTHIRYVDDPYDGNAAGTIVGKPKDLYPYDYKKVEVTVLKVGRSGLLARITSNIASNAAETPTDSGIINTCVVDSSSSPIDAATVSIFNDHVSPAVDMTVTTGSDGCIMVPNLPPNGENNYHISATKSGYSTDMTYSRESANLNSLQPDLNVYVQQISSQTLSIDKLSTLNIDIVDSGGGLIANTAVHIDGAKEKYFDPQTFKYSADLTTDGAGHIALPNMEFDNYKVTIAGYTVLTTSPYQPIDLKADTTLSARITVGNSAYPIILSCEPAKGLTGNSSTPLMIMGENLQGASVKLIAENGIEIIGTNLVYGENTVIDVDLDLSTAAMGFWDILIEKDGNSTRQLDGFEVTSE